MTTTAIKRTVHKVKPKIATRKSAPPAKKGPGRPRKTTTSEQNGKVRRVAKKTSQKAPKKAAATNLGYVPRPRVMDPYGFVVGSDSSIIAHILAKGGLDRNEVNAEAIKQIEKANGINTRGGNPKNIPSLVSGILSRLISEGFKIESSWMLVPPAKVAKKLAATEGTTATSTVRKVRTKTK